jgi:uncharacterized membrane protein
MLGGMGKHTSAGVLVRSAFVALLAALFAAPVAMAQTPSFTLVGMASGTAASRVYGLSADGRSASGYSQEPTSQNTHFPGFRWNADSGRQDFGVGLAPALTLGYGISGDGSTIVGGAYAIESGAPTAFRWSASGGYHDMGTLPGYGQSGAVDANNDGSVIVGTLSNGSASTPQGFRWTSGGGMQGLGPGTVANAVSADGGTVVGSFGDGPQAIRWTQAGGVQFLPSVGGNGNSTARGVNSDASIIVGNSGTGLWATMWVNGTPIQLNGDLDNVRLGAHAVNDAGTVVAGKAFTIGADFAGVWTASTGIVPLATYLTANGVTIPAGLQLFDCTAVSADGLTFAGYTADGPFGVQGFVATIPSPGAIGFLAIGALAAGRRRRSSLVTWR